MEHSLCLDTTLHWALIYEFNKQYSKTLSALSRASHRLRRITLSTPVLWSVILMGYRFRPYPYELFVELSQSHPLQVFLDYEPQLRDGEIIWGHHRRWKSLHWKDLPLGFFPMQISLSFPALEVLTIPGTNGVLKYFSSSQMPRLKELTIHGNIIPSRPEFPFDLIDILTNCCETLRHLSLNIRDPLEAIYPKIDLPLIHSFRLHVIIPQNGANRTGATLQSFRLPNLKRLFVNLNICSPHCPDGFFNNMEFGESLHSLALIVQFGTLQARPFSIPFRSIAYHFPNVSELFIHSPASTTEQLRECYMPNLLKLVIFKTQGKEDKFMEDILAFLRNRKMHWDEQKDCYVPLRLVIDHSIVYHGSIEQAVTDGLLVLDRCHGLWRTIDGMA